MTKIIKNIAGVVLYAGDTLALDAQRATNGEWIDKSTTSSNAVLVDGVTLPADWVGGHYTYIGTTWARTAQGTAVHDANKAAAQLAMWERIKAKREQLSDTGGYLVAGKWFHSDAKSKTQQLALARKADKVQAAGGNMAAQFSGNAGFWKTMDGSFVAMTPTLAQAIADAAELQDGAIFAAAETHRAQMMASADPAAYDYSAGWPGSFAG